MSCELKLTPRNWRQRKSQCYWEADSCYIRTNSF